MAFCHTALGDLLQGLSQIESAIAESRLGDIHGRIDKPSLANSLRSAAILLRRLNRPADAEPYDLEANELDPP